MFPFPEDKVLTPDECFFGQLAQEGIDLGYKVKHSNNVGCYGMKCDWLDFSINDKVVIEIVWNKDDNTMSMLLTDYCRQRNLLERFVNAIRYYWGDDEQQSPYYFGRKKINLYPPSKRIKNGIEPNPKKRMKEYVSYMKYMIQENVLMQKKYKIYLRKEKIREFS